MVNFMCFVPPPPHTHTQTNAPNAGSVQNNRNSHTLRGKNGTATWKTVWQFLIKLNILLTHHPANILLGIYPKDLKTFVHIKPPTRMFTIALFTIVKTWKQPK